MARIIRQTRYTAAINYIEWLIGIQLDSTGWYLTAAAATAVFKPITGLQQTRHVGNPTGSSQIKFVGKEENVGDEQDNILEAEKNILLVDEIILAIASTVVTHI